MYLNFIDFLNSFAVDFQKLFPAVRCSFVRLKSTQKLPLPSGLGHFRAQKTSLTRDNFVLLIKLLL